MKWNDLWVGGYAHIMFIVRDQGLFIESNKIYISVCWAMEFIATQETLTVLQSNIYYVFSSQKFSQEELILYTM